MIMMASPKCLMQNHTSFPGATFSHIGARRGFHRRSSSRSWKRQAGSVVMTVFAADSSSAPPASSPSLLPAISSLLPAEKRRWLELKSNRRAFASLVGVLICAAAIASKATVDTTMVNESQQMQQEMIQKLEARPKNRNIGNIDVLNWANGSAVMITKEPDAAPAKLLPEATSNEPSPTHDDHTIESTGNDSLRKIQEAANNSTNFLGYLGLLGSGVFGGLYMLERHAKDSSNSALEDVTAKLKSLEDAMKSLAAQLDGKLSDSSEQALQQYKKSMDAVRNELLSAKSSADILQKALSTEKKVSANLDQHINSLEIVLEETRKQTKEFESKFSEEEIKAIQLLEEKKELRLELDKKVVELDTLQMVMKEKEQLLKDLGSQLKTNLEALSQADSKVEELMKEFFFSLNQKFSSDDTAVQDLQEKLACANLHKEDLKKKIASVTDEFESFQKSSTLEMVVLRQEMDSKIAEAEDVSQKLSAATKDSESLKKFINDLQVEVKTLKNETSRRNSIIEWLNSELEAGFKQMDASKAERNSLLEEASLMQERNEILEKKIKDAQ